MESVMMHYTEKVAYSEEKAHKVPLADTARSRATLWCLRPGQHIHPHTHDGDHIWVVLEGTGAFVSDEDSRELGPGSVLFLPAGKSHGVTNTGEKGLVFVSITA